MKNTTFYSLKQPEDNDNVLIDDLNGNFDVIDQTLHELDEEKAAKAKPKSAGNLAELTADGALQDSGRAPGKPNGVATLDGNGKIPVSQVPNKYLPLAGGTMSGPINMGNQRITNLPKPAADTEPLRRLDGLSSLTAALFGLGADSVPDEAFAYLGKYAQHWWRRRTPAISGYVEVKEKVSKMYTIVGLDRTVKYSKNITIDKQTGAISLVAPKSLTCVHNTYGPTDFMSTLCAESPLYFTAKGNNDYETLYYLPSKSTYYDRSWTENPYTLVGYYNSNTNVMYVEIASSAPDSKKASLVTSFYNNGEPGEWEYLQSSDRSAYPDSGEQNGYEYQYLGIPFDNAATAPKIATGSYVGTGTYGADNPNSLTLEFQPQIVIIHGQTQSANNPVYNYGYTIMVRPATRYETIVTNAVDYSGTIVWGNNEVFWFVEANSGRQFNLSGEQYEYVAIG